MIFICKHCNKEIEKNKDEIKGFFNWKCPHCNEFNPIKGIFISIWNCDTGTYKKEN